VLIVAGISKVAFIALILSVGWQFIRHQAGIAVVGDVIQGSSANFWRTRRTAKHRSGASRCAYDLMSDQVGVEDKGMNLTRAAPQQDARSLQVIPSVRPLNCE
jgi:hypothetical protein